MNSNLGKNKIFKCTNEEKLLDFLIVTLKGVLSRNSIKNLLQKGQIQVNRHTVTQHDFALRSGDQVSLLPKGAVMRKSNLVILYEDSDFLAVDKPAGLLSVDETGKTADTAFHRAMADIKARNPHGTLFVVHRLDKETSGILLFCKNKTLRDAMQNAWNDLMIERRYLAIVEGPLAPDRGTLIDDLSETKTHFVYVGHESADSQKAITHYSVKNRADKYALVEVKIDTGRKNQIRAQFDHFGYPVAGDAKYHAKTNPLGRLCLWADRLVFRHPLSGVTITIALPPPPSLRPLFPTYAPDKM